MTDLSDRKYIRWDAPGVEKIPPNEQEDIQEVVKMINHMQRAQFNKGRHCFGGTHARTQGLVKGKFIIEDKLPKHLKQTELFSKAGEYDVACRYSSEPGDPGLDVRDWKVSQKILLIVIPGSNPPTSWLCYEDFWRGGRSL
jgi:hypothetical protein